MDSVDKKILGEVVNYLDELKSKIGDGKDGFEELDVAVECLRNAFGVEVATSALRSMFGEDTKVEKKEEEVVVWKRELKKDKRFKKFVDTISKKGYSKDAKEGSKQHDELIDRALEKYISHFQKAADDLKAKGNTLMKSKNYEEALKCYVKAIAKCACGPNSHQYYGNSAAARLNMKDYKGAEEDCLKGIALSPSYAKLYKRLGTAQEMQENFDDAKKSYQRAMELDSGNEATYELSLSRVENRRKKKAAQQRSAAATTTNSTAMPPGMPDLSSMGGMGGIMEMMKNPEMMAMAQNMMKDPQMMAMAQNMMQNGGLSNLMGAMGGGGGGNGDGGADKLSMLEKLRSSGAMDSMASDPDFAEMRRDMETNPMNALKHLQNPKLMAKLNGAIESLKDMGGDEPDIEEA